jgi:hypothetical protein
MKKNKFEQLTSALVLTILAVVGINAAGPLNIWNAEQRIPYRWDVSTPVKIYTDNGPFEIIPPTAGTPISNEKADEVVAFAAKQWTDVPTSSFQAEIVGDFASVGLPDVNTAATARQVITAENSGGIYVIYDADSRVMQEFFGAPPTVLGIASPEWADEETGIITEGWVIINSQQRWVGDTNLTNYAAVFTHEMGHSINLGHSQTSGAIIFYGEYKGPRSCGTTLPYSTTISKNDIETMYPFLNAHPTNGMGPAQSTVDRPDDWASISNIYPAPDYPGSKGSIKGRILQTDGETGITGVNVIARNLDNPYTDAVSAMSGDYVRVAAGDDGTFTINGLTPGARYALYTDMIVSGGFSTRQPVYLPEGEEFYNGANESGNGITDDRCEMEPITAVAGATVDADIVLNSVEGAPKFTPMLPNIFARSVSADGSIVGGGVSPGGAFRWTEGGGYQILNQTQDADAAMSRDGSVFVSDTTAPNGLRNASIVNLNSASPAWLQLPFPVVEAPSVLMTSDCAAASSASRVSADGKSVSAIVYVDTNGSLPGEACRVRPFVWNAGTGSKLLQVPASVRNSRPNSMSDDLSLVAGFHDTFGPRLGLRWENGTMYEMSTPSLSVGEASYVTPDGKFMTGNNAGPKQNPWIWTREGGLQMLGRTGPNFTASALSASDNGKVVAGLGGSVAHFPGDASGNRAFLWTPELGTVDFENFLMAQGTFFEGWRLWSSTSMSADGAIHVGSGAGPRGAAGWMINMTKVNICHAPPGNPKNTQTINIPFVDAMADHLKHGDTIGFCAGS